MECSSGDLNVGFPANDALGIGQRVAEVERGDCVEDDFERVCPVLIWSAYKAVKALRTFVKLEGSEAVFALASLSRVLALALWAWGIWLELERV